MDGNNIIIKQSYFTNIQTAINSLNEFCSSGFKVKNFPVLDGDFQLDPMLERIISRLDGVDPTWLEDEGKMNAIIEQINENIQNIDPVDGVYETIVDSNNEMMIKSIDAYVGFKVLQTVADNFQDFIKLLNGIYTFEIFTMPEKFSDVLDEFGQFIPFPEIPELDLEEKIFDEGFYVEGVFKNDQIELPQSLDIESETERIINRAPLQGYEIFVDDSVQEAAEVNYFVDTKPKHMKYSTKTKKFMVSNQFEKTINDLVAGLRKCDSTDDLAAFFKSDFWNNMRDLSETVVPFILVKVFDNPKKFTGKFNTENYTKSYDSIISKNNGAKRFQNYDIFTTFKSDKEGTIKFIEDFFKLNLVNDPDASISNNTILTLFNIFDSRIYLDIVYNHAPDTIKKEKTEDQFVKEIRGKINKNSHTAKTYTNDEGAQDPSPEDKVDTSETVSEYVINELRKLGDMNISDMAYCEQFSHIVECDIDTLGDKLYNAGISPLLVEEYIGESYNDINSQQHDFVMEANVEKKRETLQQAVCSLMANMEEIVKLDKQHRWNANSFGSRYKETINPVRFLIGIAPGGSPIGSSEQHSNIKQAYHSTKKAIKGKRGAFTSEQINALRKLNDLTGDLWANVKMFWINPANWMKELNLFKNDKTQKRTRRIADIAREIVAMKSALSFIIDNDDFISECWYDGDPAYVFQEATSEKNRERLRTAVNILMTEMQKISDLAKKNQWTNNSCINTFKGEAKSNVKQALKYVTRGETGSCGKLQDQEINTLKNLREKIEELLATVKKININPFVGKNIKEADSVRKISSLAKDILAMKGDLEFVNSAVVKDADGPAVANVKGESGEKPVTEAYVFQESKQTHMKRTLKKFDYDPKTDTILTDITMPDGKEKMRAKLVIDNAIDGPCMCFEDGKPVIYMRRKDLKQKSWYAAFTLRHEEGHIAHGHNSGDNSGAEETYSVDVAHVHHKDSKGEFNKAWEFLDKKWKTASDADKDNDHDWAPEELMADKYGAKKTSSKSAIKSLERMYKEGEQVLKKNAQVYRDIINRSKKKDKSDPERAKLRKEYKDLESKFYSLWKSNPSDEEKKFLNNITKKLKEIDKLLVDREAVEEAEEAIEFVEENIAAWRDAKNRRIEYIAKHVNEYGVVLDINAFAVIMEGDESSGGELPKYIKDRFKMTDTVGTTVTPAGLPDGVPQNPVSDMTDSIDAKLSTGGDNLGDMLGAGFENNPNKDKAEGKIVVNVTNNYNNSFNRDSNNTTTNTTTNDDHSTGKTTTTTNTNSNNKSNSDNDNSHDNQTDSSSNKSIKKSSVTKKKTDNSDRSHTTQTKGSNNNNNSNDSVDLKDSPTSKDGEQKLSSGKTVQEMFMFLESKEPQSSEFNAKPPKEDLLTKAMDKDRKMLPKQQGAKRGVQKVANTGKAVLKPVTRTKQWLTKLVNSLIKRDEDNVKSELLENKSYRSAVFKASRLALKLGLVSVAFSIQPYLGLTVAGVEGLRLADRNRLKKELQREMEAELEVVEEKIKDLESINTPEARKEKYEYMRLKKQIEQNMIEAPKRHTKSSYWDSY